MKIRAFVLQFEFFLFSELHRFCHGMTLLPMILYFGMIKFFRATQTYKMYFLTKLINLEVIFAWERLRSMDNREAMQKSGVNTVTTRCFFVWFHNSVVLIVYLLFSLGLFH